MTTSFPGAVGLIVSVDSALTEPGPTHTWYKRQPVSVHPCGPAGEQVGFDGVAVWDVPAQEGHIHAIVVFDHKGRCVSAGKMAEPIDTRDGGKVAVRCAAEGIQVSYVTGSSSVASGGSSLTGVLVDAR